MKFSRSSRGFTLIEVVLVLVLLGILAAVAIQKYYDLTKKSEDAAAYAYAEQFAAEFNGELAGRILQGEDCATARRTMMGTRGYIGEKYMYGNSEMGINTQALLNEDVGIIPVYLKKDNQRLVLVPSHIIKCGK